LNLHVLFRWIILSIFDVETINKLMISHINSVNFLYLLEEGLKHRVWEDGMPNWHDMVEGSPQWWSLAIVIAHDRCFYASIVRDSQTNLKACVSPIHSLNYMPAEEIVRESLCVLHLCWDRKLVHKRDHG
jgi:hypothetical protein